MWPKYALIMDKKWINFSLHFTQNRGGGSDPNVKNVTLFFFFFNEGFPNEVKWNNKQLNESKEQNKN